MLQFIKELIKNSNMVFFFQEYMRHITCGGDQRTATRAKSRERHRR